MLNQLLTIINAVLMHYHVFCLYNAMRKNMQLALALCSVSLFSTVALITSINKDPTFLTFAKHSGRMMFKAA